MPDKYILADDGVTPVPVADLFEWATWFEDAYRNRRNVVQQDYAEGTKQVGVSTIFLGLNHNFSGTGPPVLWESLVFGTALDREMRRYSSYAEALRGHAELLARVREVYDAEQRAEHR